MPINVTGDTVNEITIDGDVVEEVTIDGEVAYRLLPDTILSTEIGRLWNYETGNPLYNVRDVVSDDVGSVSISQRYIAYVNGTSEVVVFDYVSQFVVERFSSGEVYYDVAISPDQNSVFVSGAGIVEAYDISSTNKIFEHEPSNWQGGDISICACNNQYAIYGVSLDSDSSTIYVSDYINDTIQTPYSQFGIRDLRAVDISPLYHGIGGGELDQNGDVITKRTRSGTRVTQQYNDAVLDVAVADDLTAVTIDGPNFNETTVEVYQSNTGTFEQQLISNADNISVNDIQITDNRIIVLDDRADEIYVYDKNYSLVNSFSLSSSPRQIAAIRR